MTPQEKIKNNEFLLSLDMSNASRKQKIAWLCQIIKNETEKIPEEQDLDLIAECTEYMQELSEGETIVSTEKKEQALREVKSNNPALEKKGSVITKKPKVLLKIAAVAAALFVLAFSTLTVAAKVQGYQNACEFLVTNVEKFLDMLQGDSLEEGGITLIKGGESISYPDMEALLVGENLDILYPTQLPEGVQIEKISRQEIKEDYIIYSFQFTDTDMSVVISNVQNVSQEDISRYELYKTSNATFYIKLFSSGMYQAVACDGNYEYLISHKDYDTLIKILDGMKGMEK